MVAVGLGFGAMSMMSGDDAPEEAVEAPAADEAAQDEPAVAEPEPEEDTGADEAAAEPEEAAPKKVLSWPSRRRTPLGRRTHLRERVRRSLSWLRGM